MNFQVIRERYLQDDFPRRLGALAANLARVVSFSKRGENLDVVKSLLRESEYFIEWTILEASLDLQERLVKLQVELALWLGRLDRGENGFDQLARDFQDWSEEILSASRLA